MTAQRVKYVCCYRTGPKFSPGYAYKLKSMVDRHSGGLFDFVCITDDPVLLNDDGFKHTIPLERPEKTGWWCLPEKFRITGPVVFSGLDTVIIGDLKPFIDMALNCPKDTVYMIHPFRLPNYGNRVFANGMMAWNGDLRYMYNDYDYRVAAGCVLEQDYTSAMLIKSGKNIRVIQHEISGIHSFKRDLHKQGPLPDTRVVLFHGRPGVHEVRHFDWIKEHWR